MKNEKKNRTLMVNKIIKYIIHPSLILMKLDDNGFIKLSDKHYLSIKYKYYIGDKIDWKNPKGFNEKLQWLKLYDRNDLYTKLVDKYEVKKIVGEIIGDEYIIPTIGIYDSFSDIDFNKLSNQFVIKCTHDSGSVVVCSDKNNFNYLEAESIINNGLKRKFYYWGREWPYKNVKPRIIVEKYMGAEIIDYKLMCFNGKMICSFVCTNRFSENGLNVTFFDKNWNKMPFERHYPMDRNAIEKPVNYDKMIDLAEKLSKNIPFVRVDFYEVNNKIYFGEMTFYPGCGFEEFNPKEWDYKLGSLIELPKK